MASCYLADDGTPDQGPDGAGVSCDCTFLPEHEDADEIVVLGDFLNAITANLRKPTTSELKP